MNAPMIQPQHHPAEETLLAYANGCLGEAESLIIATHLAFCPACRKTAKVCECVGGKLLEDTAAVSVSSACKDKLFAALDATDCDAAPAPAKASPACFIPEPLRGYLGGAGCRSGVQELAWEPMSAAQAQHRLKVTSCCARRGAGAALIRLKPGAALELPVVPRRQMLLMLCGALTRGETHYRAGDFIMLGDAAGWRSCGDEACFMLHVVTPLRGNWLSRALQLALCRS